MARSWGQVNTSGDPIGVTAAVGGVSDPQKGSATPSSLMSITRTVPNQPLLVIFSSPFEAVTADVILTLYLYVDGTVVDHSTRRHHFLDVGRHHTIAGVWGVQPGGGSRAFAVHWETENGTMRAVAARRSLAVLCA